MRILFLGYWNLDDPLTQATVLPNLVRLCSFLRVKKIVLANVQREQPSKQALDELVSLGIEYKPLYSKNFGINFLNKINDFLILPRQILNLVKEFHIDEIIARGAPAGALALLARKNYNIPFSVESYEPHADYMRHSGVWRIWDPRYIAQNMWERKIIKEAKFLFPVSEKYRQELISQGVHPLKLITVPCAVNLQKFSINIDQGKAIRRELGIPSEAIVGVYAGKFGGLYYKEEAFSLFRDLINDIEDCYIMLLSSADENMIRNLMHSTDIGPNRCIHKFIPHHQMTHYLNAADFAIATYKSTPVSSFLSPVKVGEYWACGLPVLISENVGDEQEFIEQEGLGLTINVEDVLKRRNAILKFKQKLGAYKKQEIRTKGIALRSQDFVDQAYDKLLN